MIRIITKTLFVTACLTNLPAIAQEAGMAKPDLLLRQLVEGMPRGEKQEVRILTAILRPGDKTPFHTHRSPVAVYVLEGTFTLELEGQAPKQVSAGEAMIEPPSVPMTGFNHDEAKPAKVVIFYVSDPDTPFLDPIH
jgi:quercetin dioxygenase-like cupin family protein